MMNSSDIRVLLVEDEVMVAMCIVDELERAGYVLLPQATTGAEAVEIAAAYRPDVILMDIHLSGEMDGIQAARKIQAQASPAIIFMTGYTDTETVRQVREVKPAGYLEKPVRFANIDAAIQAAVSGGPRGG
jgi:two-component system, response regulator PdtaR